MATTAPFQTLAIAEVTQQMFDAALRAIADKFQGYDVKPVWPGRTIIASKPGTVPDVHPHIFIMMDGKHHVLDVSGKGNPKDYAIALDITTSKVIDTSDIEDAVIVEEQTKTPQPPEGGDKTAKKSAKKPSKPTPSEECLPIQGDEGSISPMVKQFYDLKKKHPDRLLLFRCGDFYETYGEDARLTSQTLGITLTKSSKTKDKDGKPLCMAGFPCTALDTYLPKLIRANVRVAICDQLEDPRLTKKLVKRGITDMVKPASEEKEYDVDITETLFRSVRIKASSKQEAIEKVNAMYANSEIVLSADDMCGDPIIEANLVQPSTPKTDETSDDQVDLEFD